MLPRLAALALLLACSSAAAQAKLSPPPPDAPMTTPHLTSRGRIVLAASGSGVWSREMPAMFVVNHTGMLLGMAEAFYFVRDGLGVGLAFSGGSGAAELSYNGATVMRRGDRDMAVQVRALFDVPISRKVSLFYDAGLGWAWNMASETSFGQGFDGTTVRLGNETRNHYLRITAKVPLVYRVTSHFGVGAGPELTVDTLLATEALDQGWPEDEGQVGYAQEKQRVRMQAGGTVSLYVSF